MCELTLILGISVSNTDDIHIYLSTPTLNFSSSWCSPFLLLANMSCVCVSSLKFHWPPCKCSFHLKIIHSTLRYVYGSRRCRLSVFVGRRFSFFVFFIFRRFLLLLLLSIFCVCLCHCYKALCACALARSFSRSHLASKLLE